MYSITCNEKVHSTSFRAMLPFLELFFFVTNMYLERYTYITSRVDLTEVDNEMFYVCQKFGPEIKRRIN